MNDEQEITTLEIYLVGGQIIVLDVKDWKLKKSNLSNELTELSWTIAGNDSMPFISLKDVTAVVTRVKESGSQMVAVPSGVPK
jgi:hypothetical protein